MCLTAREQFACFYFEFSLATWSVSKNQMRFDHMHLIACKAVCLCSLWVLIGYAICLQKPKAIKSHMFNCMWANFLVFNLSSHWLSDLLPKPIWSHMFDCKWAVCLFSLWVLISYPICCQKLNAIWLYVFDCTWSSLLVFNLSSDWLGNLFPNTNHTCLIVPEELACFYFEFWLSIRSVFKIRTQFGQFGLIGSSDICLHSDWRLWLLWSFDFHHWIKFHFRTNLTETLTWFSFLLWIHLLCHGYFHLARLEGN